jgi:hypothetical protein
MKSSSSGPARRPRGARGSSSIQKCGARTRSLAITGGVAWASTCSTARRLASVAGRWVNSATNEAPALASFARMRAASVLGSLSDMNELPLRGVRAQWSPTQSQRPSPMGQPWPAT